MDSTGGFIQEMLLLYVLALLGFIARRTGILNEHANGVFTPFILYITLPALILYSLDISFSLTRVKEFMWLISMSVYVLVLSMFMANWMRKRSPLPINQQSVYEGLIIFGNQGYIGYAVIFILFGEEGIAYLTIFNIYYLFLIWTYGIHLFHKSKDELINWKMIFLNPGVLSTCTGILIFFLPIGWPDIVSNGLEMVGKMSIPLSMIIIGSFMANVKGESFFSLLKMTSLWKMAVAKLLMIPLLLIPFAALPIRFPLVVIAVLVSGLPSAPTISLYAQKYGADSFFASIGVLVTTVLCMMTIPFLYFILNLISQFMRG